MILIAFIRPYLRSQVPGEFAEAIVAAAATSLFGFITLRAREPLRWRIGFGLLTLAFAVALLAFVVLWWSKEIQELFALSLILLSVFPFVAAFSALFDVADRHRYDIFHWIGVIALFGVGAKFATAMIVNHLVR